MNSLSKQPVFAAVDVLGSQGSLRTVNDLIAGDKRSPQTIIGHRHILDCITRFFQNLSTFLGYLCSAYLYAWHVAEKALVLSIRSI